MRILHIENTAGVATLLARGERALGHTSGVLETWRNYTNYEHDFEIYYEGSKYHILGLMRDVINLARDFDIIHVHSGMALRRVDYIYLRRVLRKPLVVHYHGSETRLGYGMHYQSLADAKIVATPDLLPYHPGAAFIPNPMEPMKASWPEGELRFVHLPTVREKKGTDHVLRAIRELEAEGRRVIFTLREHIPHDQALREIARSNVVIDQVASRVDGAPAGLMGVLSLEGMAMGKVIVNAMKSDGYGRFYPPRYPGIFGDERSVKEVMASLMDDPEEARRLGEQGKQWISEHLKPEIIAREHVKLYEHVLNNEHPSSLSLKGWTRAFRRKREQFA